MIIGKASSKVPDTPTHLVSSLTPPQPRSGVLSLYTIDMGGWIILRRGGCPVHCWMISSIPGLYPLDARSTLFPEQGQLCPQTLPSAPWWTNSSPVEKLCCRLMSSCQRAGSTWHAYLGDLCVSAAMPGSGFKVNLLVSLLWQQPFSFADV